MPTILHAGVAVLDFVFALDTFPTTADKHRAKDATIVNGGNAANAAIACARLGGNAVLAARLGDDAIADFIINGLESEQIDTGLVRRFQNFRSSFSSVFIDAAGERQIVNFRDQNLSMAADWLAPILPSGIDAFLTDTRWPDGARIAMQAARDRGVPGIMDGESPVFEAEEAIHLASHVAFSGPAVREFASESDLETAMRKASTILSGKVYATDGADGAFFMDGDRLENVPAFPVTTIDTLGAGDTWHAALALALAEGVDDLAAMRFANAAAALKCKRPGGISGAPTRKEVDEFLRQKT